MKKLEILKLSPDSRYLQKLALKTLGINPRELTARNFLLFWRKKGREGNQAYWRSS